jgi:aspartate/methionine/tyrosine aminotransferase
LSDLITARTKAIVLVSPSNPTGKIFSESELRRVGEIARNHDLLILLDDPYRHFTYENSEKYFNLASVGDLANRIAYLFTFSKAHAMSGWRLGYMIVPECLKKQVLKVHDATIICTPRISQVAGFAALTEQSDHLLEFEQTLAKRRELICERLDRVPHVFTYVKPEGAYYVFPKIVIKHDDSYKFALDLLESARVSVTPGSAFGPTGEHHVRMAYCVPEDMIDKAFDRIEKQFPI